MCGIIGYIGEKEAAPILFEALRKLEYRGYDSAGICTIDNGHALIEKDIGKLDEFKQKIDFEKQNIFEQRHCVKPSFVKNFHPLPVNSEMKIFNLINNEDYYTIVDESIQKLFKRKIRKSNQEIAKDLGISYQTLLRILNTNNYWANMGTLFGLCKLLSIKKSVLLESIVLIKTKNSFPFDISKFTISNAFIRILGHLIGDGGIHLVEKEGKYRPFYVNNERELLRSFSADVKAIFGIDAPYFRKRIDHGDEIWLQTSIGKVLYNILEYQRNNNKKRVPRFIYGLDKGFIGSFLQALYDDEGFLYPQKNMIVISLSSKELIEDIRNLVVKIGIRPNRILVHNSKTRTRMFYFSITHRDNIRKFYEGVGFLHPQKKKKLEILMDKYR